MNICTRHRVRIAAILVLGLAAALPSSEAQTTADESGSPCGDTLAVAEDLRNSGALGEAVAAYLNVFVRCSGTKEANIADTRLSDLAFDLRRKAFSEQDFTRLDSLVSGVDATFPLDARVAVLPFIRLRAMALARSGDAEAASQLLSKAVSIARNGIETNADNALCIRLADEYLVAAKRLGPEAFADAVAFLRANRDSPWPATRFAAHCGLLLYWRDADLDIAEMRRCCERVLAEASGDALQSVLQDPATCDRVLAYYEYFLGVAHFQLAQYPEAQERFQHAIDTYPYQGRPSYLAGYGLAVTRKHFNRTNADETGALHPMEEYAQQFPDSSLLDWAKFSEVRGHFGKGDATKAGAAYEELLASHPDSDGARAARDWKSAKESMTLPVRAPELTELEQ